jgi:uncharacterized protein (DUF1778 family)
VGRPPLSDERKTDTPLKIRLTDAERAELDLAAKAAGEGTSTWARDLLLRAARTKNKKAVKR